MPPKPCAVLGSTPSDSHTWNLLFVQLLMEENGWSVTNLGACVPLSMLIDESLRRTADMIVISTVNGHGTQEARQAIEAIRAQPSLARVPVFLGGKISVSEDREREAVGELVAAGYDGVLVGDDAVPAFRTHLTQAATVSGRWS
jgi:methylaspartate mutase sigma subunit